MLKEELTLVRGIDQRSACADGLDIDLSNPDAAHLKQLERIGYDTNA